MRGGSVPSKTGFRRTQQSAARDMRAAELHGQGWTYQRIADELGFAHRGKACEAVQRAFDSIPLEGAERAKIADLERLDRLIEQAWAVMLRPHVTVSNGHVIRRFAGVERDDDGIERLDMDGKPIPVFEDVMDDAPVLAAIDRIARLIERRAKIFGYEAPAKSRVEFVPEDAVDAEIAQLTAEMAERDRSDPGVPGEAAASR